MVPTSKFKVNEGYDGERVVEADRFLTQGEFVDFLRYFDGDTHIVLRLRTTDVRSVEIISPVKATVTDAEPG